MSVIKTALLITALIFSNNLYASETHDDDEQPSAKRRPVETTAPNLVSLNNLGALSLFANDDPRVVESLKKDVLISHMAAFSGNQQHVMEVWSYQLKELPYQYLLDAYLDGRFNGLVTADTPYHYLLNLSPETAPKSGYCSPLTFTRKLPVVLLQPHPQTVVLRELWLSRCGLMIINGLSTLKGLEVLDVSSNPLLNLNVYDLTSLKTLRTNSCPLTRIEGLNSRHTPSLEVLSLRGCGLLDPDCIRLGSLEHLYDIDFSGTQVSHLPSKASESSFRALTSLKTLCLTGTPLKSFDGLKSLTALTSLTLSPEHLTSVPDLEKILATLSFRLDTTNSTWLWYHRKS